MDTETRVVREDWKDVGFSEKGKSRMSTPNHSNDSDNGMMAGNQCGVCTTVRQLMVYLERI